MKEEEHLVEISMYVLRAYLFLPFPLLIRSQVSFGEDEGMGLPTQSTFYSNFPSNILNESA